MDRLQQDYCNYKKPAEEVEVVYPVEISVCGGSKIIITSPSQEKSGLPKGRVHPWKQNAVTILLNPKSESK